ncbi:O-antigen/teichoic acid export membrane protein [Planomicrobium stackebrandtii]|uniref:O-antigen/teichoic acid export membrane protein n=1 Tax=Planomicrobium stackebrandtii TaxID=253160 RepID=A0ABU0GU24_9BACL|nr:lipopolysaccharide biosynthesis protein [Planomicrobium stackebrandtii]MDQ0428866.1 O-antigen/teichoic acid export membrane protein [Planomicrobium stackebrandtii]
MKQENSLKKKTISGLLWSFGDMIGNQGIQFIIQIILARLLVPEDFGIIGMILVFVALSNSLVDSGFTQALIRDQKADQTDYSTVFYFNLAVSVIIYGLLFLSAPLISNFFEQDQLTAIVRVLALGVVINAFSIIPRAMFTKEVDFKVQAKVNMAASVLSGIVAVAMALLGFGVWSLVVRMLALNGIQAVLLVFYRRWLPSLVFSTASFKRLFGFGWKLLVSGLIDTAYNNIYYLIIGKQYSATSLGYYTNASKFSDVATQTLTATIQRVTYPVLSGIQDQEERLKQSFKKVIKLSGFLIFPVMVGVAAVADPLIYLIFGEKWMTMVPYFQLLCIAGMLYPIHALNLNILQVKGRSDLFLYLEIIKTIVPTVLILIVIWMDWGITILVVTIVLDSYISLFINIYFSGREISYGVREQIVDLLPIYAISMGMGLVVYGIEKLLPFPELLTLLLQIAVGAAIYIAICRLLKIKEFDTVYDLLVPMLKKIKPAKTG